MFVCGRGRPISCWDERIEQAGALKDDGNVRYRSGNYSGAISKYRQVLFNLDLHQHGPDDTRPTDEQMDSINSLLVDSHNNLAGNLL